MRRQAEALRDWFARETGWMLQVEREGARLYKRPADLTDATRGLPGYDRRRYVLLCLACAVLERADPQITLAPAGRAAAAARRRAGARSAASPSRSRRNTSGASWWRCAARCWTSACCSASPATRRRSCRPEASRPTRSTTCSAACSPACWRRCAARRPGQPEEAPATLEERLHALVDEHVADSEEGRRTALRHQLARRLLDDPVVYVETLDPEARAYFLNQRGAMAARLCEAAGLVAEQRAEGLALVDEAGLLTDVAMPAEGTDAHVTLLVAEHLATAPAAAASRMAPTLRRLCAMREHDIADFLREAKGTYGRYWRKSAREPGAERELAAIAIERLEKLQLVARRAGAVHPLPALARFALGEAEIRESAQCRRPRPPALCSDRHERPLQPLRFAAAKARAADADAAALAAAAARVWWSSSTTTARNSGSATAICCCAATTAPASPRCCR